MANSKAYHSEALERLGDNTLPISVLNINAMAAGKNSPVPRNRASESEWEFFWDRVSQRLSEQTLEEITTLQPEQYSDETSCELMVQVNVYISELPDAESAFWAANVDGMQ